MVLRIVLYPILFVCLMWAAAILIGPKILMIILNHYSNERIFVDNLNVEPDLSLTASNLLYTKEHSETEDNEIFNFRAIQLTWGFEKLLPIVKLSIGPSELGSFGAFDGLAISVWSKNFLFWSGINFSGELSNTDFYSSANFNSGKFEGEISSPWTRIENVSFNISDLSFDDAELENLEWLRLTSDALELNLPFEKQLNRIVLNTSPIKIEGLSSEIDLGTVTIENNRGLVNGIIITKSLDIPEYNVDLENLSLVFSLNLKTFSENFEINAQVGRVFSSKINFNIEESKATAVYNKGNLKLRYVGKINEFELKQKNTFLGKLPKGHFEFMISASKSEIGALLDGNSKYVLSSDPKMQLRYKFHWCYHGRRQP